MADAAAPQEESEEFLRRSGIRCGRKRELEFALKSQSEFASSLGRTRSCRKDAPDGSASSCDEVLPSPASGTASSASGDGALVSYKRQKKSSGDSEKPPIVEDKTTQNPPDADCVGNGFVEKPVRRFTRSALKVDEPGSSEAEAVKEAVVGSVKNEDLNVEKAGNAVSPVKTSAKNKLELKMSKKIVLENIPTDVKELLATGLLEGLRVRYRFRGNKVGALHGKVKDGGILCSCTSCKGRKVITAPKFERHAGSRNRYAEQIYLENGNNLRYVLDACQSAPLKLLETIIQSAISTFAAKKGTICLNCKESFYLSWVGKSPFICKDCRVPKQSQARPTLMATRLLKQAKAMKTSKKTSKDNSPEKKRGRPPKKLARTSKENSMEKKRGRPPKKLVNTSKDNSLEKKRGRPPKKLVNTSRGNSLEKKRGHPPKKLVNTSRDNSMEKKRGRPPKKLVSTSKDNSMERKRGRPPKKLVSTSKDNSLEKKRGRPPKKLVSTSKDNSLEKKSGRQTKNLVGTSKYNTMQKKGRLTKKDLRLHKLVFMEDVLPDGTEVGYYSHGKKLLTGYKKGIGIFCCCCNSEVTPSQFEAHAGWAVRRKPYQYIYTSNGVSLHELSISLSKGRKFSAHDNDDLCTICADGGNLLLCDGCPRAFHEDCAELSCIPQGDWYCLYCQRMFERENFVEFNDNAFAAGRVPGVDPIEQITKRCIRIVQTPEADVTVCVLCRCHDFRKTGFGSRTVLLCDQCEKEYHVGCLKEHNMADLKGQLGPTSRS